MTVLGMLLIVNALGVLVVLALIFFGVVSVTIIRESRPKNWKWSNSSHPETLKMLRKHKEEGVFDFGWKITNNECASDCQMEKLLDLMKGENNAETEKEKNPDRG